jgi:hypothetical protein
MYNKQLWQLVWQGRRIKINDFFYDPLSKFTGGSDGAL